MRKTIIELSLLALCGVAPAVLPATPLGVALGQVEMESIRGGSILCDVDCDTTTMSCAIGGTPAPATCDPTVPNPGCPGNGSWACSDPTQAEACIDIDWGPGIMCGPDTPASIACTGRLNWNSVCLPVPYSPSGAGFCASTAAPAAACTLANGAPITMPQCKN